MLIVLSGGGPAGHINPALALADVLKQRGCEVRFAGTPTGVEARLVREAGIPFTPFEAQGFNRNHPLTLPKAVLTIQKSTTLARRWFDEIRPDAVVGFGGYVCIPVARAAEQRGIPVVVHEQNSVMGMANKYLGKTIDIHSGGLDLIFPHHENEIAQSECCNDKIFARYWMHNAFLNIDNRKMSKSLGNFRTVREISEQYDLQVLRFFMLSAHYRSPLNFSAELMEASKNGLERILNATDNLKHLIASVAAEEMSAEEKEAFSKTDAYVEEFEKAMDDDFNTADAIAAIFELVKYANTTATAESSKEYLRGLLDRIVKLDDVLGLILDKKEELLDADIEKLIEERQAARKAKDFARADAIRDELLEKGIILKDTREGVQWKKA